MANPISAARMNAAAETSPEQDPGLNDANTSPAPETPAAENKVANYYCLEARHPGVTELVDEGRFFHFAHPLVDLRLPDGTKTQVPSQGAPVCPLCLDRYGKPRQVSAVSVDEVDGVPQIPQSILILAERL